MGKYEAPPFARGETIYNGDAITTTTADLANPNLEGREYEFEPNSQAQESGNYTSNVSIDPTGRPIRVKVVRNVSGVNLLPKRVVHFQAATTMTGSVTPYEGRVDGYCTSVADRPAGVVDEFLPAAGVPNNDLFYLVIDGPTIVQQASGAITSGAILNVGDRLVSASAGTAATDANGGRVVAQLLAASTDAGTALTAANQIQNRLGFVAALGVTSTSGGLGTAIAAIVHLNRW